MKNLFKKLISFLYLQYRVDQLRHLYYIKYKELNKEVIETCDEVKGSVQMINLLLGCKMVNEAELYLSKGERLIKENEKRLKSMEECIKIAGSYKLAKQIVKQNELI